MRGDVGGLVVNRQADDERAWALTHAATGMQLLPFAFVARSEAAEVAARIAGLADWKRALLPELRDAVVRELREVTSWRDARSDGYVGMVASVADRLDPLDDSASCDGTWHVVPLGWRRAFVRLGTKLGSGEHHRVLRFADAPDDARAITVWCYERSDFMCLDCGAFVS